MLSNRLVLALVLTLIPLPARPHDGRQEAPGSIRITWLGHAAIEVVSPGGTRLRIDPWLLQNPYTPAEYKDTTRWTRAELRPQALVMTHAHGDHDGDGLLLSRLTGAKVVATGDHLQAMQIPEAQYLSINIGGVQRVGDVEVHAVPAMHYGPSVAPFATEEQVRAAFRGDRRLTVLVPGTAATF